MKLRLRFLMLATLLSVSSHGWAERGDADSLLAKSLLDISQSRVGIARSAVDRLTAIHPNFRLAQLVKGDLLLARSQPLSTLGNINASRNALEDLRQEARQRVHALTNPLPINQIPSYLLNLGDDYDYAMVVDTSRSRLYVFANRGGLPVRVADYYVTIGKAGAGKQKEGDNRTPVGIYQIAGFKPASQLGDFYGAGAFTLSYPNEWDSRLGRSGHGIWIHGTPSNTYSRAPRASEGCVVLANEDLKSLGLYVQKGRTPVIISESVDWVSSDEVASIRNELSRALDQWRTDWESLDTSKLLANYSHEYRSASLDYARFAQSKKRINASKAWVKVGISRVSLMLYPERPGLAVVSFLQDYKSSNANDRTQKKQFWSRENGRWKIIQEAELQQGSSNTYGQTAHYAR